MPAPEEKLVYGRPASLVDRPTHYCPGCGHGIIHKLLAQAIDELGVRERTILIAPVGCSVLAYYYLAVDGIEAAHGRARHAYALKTCPPAYRASHPSGGNCHPRLEAYPISLTFRWVARYRLGGAWIDTSGVEINADESGRLGTTARIVHRAGPASTVSLSGTANPGSKFRITKNSSPTNAAQNFLDPNNNFHLLIIPLLSRMGKAFMSFECFALFLFLKTSVRATARPCPSFFSSILKSQNSTLDPESL